MAITERNICLLIAYDGTRYQGWQKQKEDLTIQGTIEEILTRITQQPVSLFGAGRTDAGVHAWGQVASFRTTSELRIEKIEAALRALLPRDILIRQVRQVEPDFHARYSSKAKVYDYFIWNQTPCTPFLRHFVWFVQEPIEVSLVKAGLSFLKGEKDFSAFQSKGSEVSHAVRIVSQALLLPVPWGGFRLRFKADGFLRHMVRNMVGTLIRVGLKRTPIEELEEIILSKDRSRAGEMAPAQGLFLRKVLYP
ncbi:MAG: tRNA pseudouridine(38-40) synthase TruA [Deltaproteobacteria bacterium RBG_13_43_22]|nr:MAG: tRNA pseudouridine(38-40) synthase TruA [Deltaproteobacteria bacterium RBG_13_43_22]